MRFKMMVQKIKHYLIEYDNDNEAYVYPSDLVTRYKSFLQELKEVR